MRVRSYDEVDPFEVFRLNLLSFGEAWDEARIRRARRYDRMCFDEFALFAEDRGRLLAQVVPLRFQVRLRTGIEEVGGLAGVCSHPGVWGQGYARRLMEAAHARFRDLGFRISTLTTSRNIRGYGVYADLGYLSLAPFRKAFHRANRIRRPITRTMRRARLSDLGAMHALYRRQTRGLLGWTERPAGFMAWKTKEDPRYLSKYRVMVRDRSIVAYVRASPRQPAFMDEVVAPAPEDFRAAVRLCESTNRHGTATVSWITAEADARRFQSLGYSIEGPIGDVTMAVSLRRDLRTTSLPTLFGGPAGRFVHYPTDDF